MLELGSLLLIRVIAKHSINFRNYATAYNQILEEVPGPLVPEKNEVFKTEADNVNVMTISKMKKKMQVLSKMIKFAMLKKTQLKIKTIE